MTYDKATKLRNEDEVICKKKDSEIDALFLKFLATIEKSMFLLNIMLITYDLNISYFQDFRCCEYHPQWFSTCFYIYSLQRYSKIHKSTSENLGPWSQNYYNK